MPDTAPLVRIEISHPETDDPTWLQEWDGTHLTTSFHPDAAPDAGNIEDWGGYAFNDEWEDLFSKWAPRKSPTKSSTCNWAQGSGHAASPRSNDNSPPGHRAKTTRNAENTTNCLPFIPIVCGCLRLPPPFLIVLASCLSSTNGQAMTKDRSSIARYAIYARYSSHLQEMTSIAGQFRLCRERVARQCGVIVNEYFDPESTGTTMNGRPGLQQLRDDARAGRLDTVCVEALDRLARNQADMAYLYSEFGFYGVDIHTLEDGQVDGLHAAIKGFMSEMASSNIGNKTRRGQIEALHDLRVTGPQIYGYRIANRISDSGKPIRGLRVIDPEEAEVVRRIHRLYLDGMSPRQLVLLLNDEGIPGPRGGAWTADNIRGRDDKGILRNSIYQGILIYGRTKSRRHPVTGKRSFVRLPRDQWKIAEAPELRIVDPETWDAVQQELHRRRNRHLAVFNPYRRAAYPLTARIRCGTCGSHMVITGQRSYRCAARRLHPERCSNNRGIALEKLERAAVQQLLNWMRDPHRDWTRMFFSAERANASRRRELKDRFEEANAGIVRIVAAIESGVSSTSLRDRLLDLERTRNAAVTDLDAIPASPPPDTPDIRGFVMSYTDRFRGTVIGSERTDQREQTLLALRELIASITVSPSSGPYRVDITTTPDVPAILGLIAQHFASCTSMPGYTAPGTGNGHRSRARLTVPSPRR